MNRYPLDIYILEFILLLMNSRIVVGIVLIILLSGCVSPVIDGTIDEITENVDNTGDDFNDSFSEFDNINQTDSDDSGGISEIETGVITQIHNSQIQEIHYEYDIEIYIENRKEAEISGYYINDTHKMVDANLSNKKDKKLLIHDGTLYTERNGIWFLEEDDEWFGINPYLVEGEEYRQYNITKVPSEDDFSQLKFKGRKSNIESNAISVLNNSLDESITSILNFETTLETQENGQLYTNKSINGYVLDDIPMRYEVKIETVDKEDIEYNEP